MKGNQSTLMQALYEAGLVQRWHTIPHHGDAMVSTHSWGVAVFILTFHDGLPGTDELEAVPGPSMRLIRAALLHDVHERWSGDSPNPARRSFPGMQDGEDEAQRRFWAWAQPLWCDESEWHPEACLSERELAWLKLADAAEAYFWCQHQALLGNQHVKVGEDLMNSVIRKIITDKAHCFLDPGGLWEAVHRTRLSFRLPDHMSTLEEQY